MNQRAEVEQTELAAADIEFHVVDFSRMPEAGAIPPGFYYTFPVTPGEGREPFISLTGPYPTFKEAVDKARTFIAEGLTNYQGDEADDVSEEEVDFTDDVDAVVVRSVQ